MKEKLNVNLSRVASNKGKISECTTLNGDSATRVELFYNSTDLNLKSFVGSNNAWTAENAPLLTTTVVNGITKEIQTVQA